MNDFELEVYTPAGKMFSGTATSLKLPSSNGEIGILAGHVSYVGLLGTGVMELASAQGNKRMVVAGGFVSVDGTKLSILADYAVTPDSVAPDYNKDRESLQAQLEELPYDVPEAKRARQKLALIKAIDTLVSH